MREVIASNVVRRYLASVVPVTAYDSRYVPPRGVAEAVKTGKLPPETLEAWQYVVERLGDRFNYQDATKYWRNKCRLEGIDLPKEFDEGSMGGKGGAGSFSVSTGDQIEEWVKANMLSRSLMDVTGRSCAAWQMWINHWEKEIKDAQDRVEKHIAGLAKAKSEAGVRQKQEWLDKARVDLGKATDELEKARKALTALQEAIKRHDKAQTAAIDFEEQFQFMLKLLNKTLAEQDVVKVAEEALRKFQQGLATVDVDRYEEYGTPRTAGIGDWLTKLFGFLDKAWTTVKTSLKNFGRWLGVLESQTADLDKLLSAAGA